MALVLHSKVVATLPSTLIANTIYYVRVGTGMDIYVTNSSGTIVAYPLNASIKMPILKRQTVTLPLIAIGNTDISFTWSTPFTALSGLTTLQTIARISVLPMASPMGVSTSLLGKVVVAVKSWDLSGGILTISNTGLISLAVGTTVDVIGFLEPL